MNKPFSQWTDADVAQHEQHVATMKTAQQHNAPLVGEVNLSASIPRTIPPFHCGSHPSHAVGKEIKADHACADSHTTRSWTIKIEPMGAPRMTQRDKWKKRPVVLRYHAYKDAIRAVVGDLPVVPDEMHLRFFMAMPESWSIKKALKMCGQPHRQRPDFDNLEKGLADTLFLEDGGIWKASTEKRWTDRSEGGRIELTMIWHQPIKLDPQPQQ